MRLPQSRFRINDAEITADVFDGEAIILNLATGAYYSIDKAGGLIWSMIAAGHSLEEVVAALRTRYDVPEAEAHADVERVVDDLVRENLVLASEGNQAPEPFPETTAPERVRYVTPTLNIYRDMGDMLALDPPMPRLDEIPWKETESDGRHPR
jgi:Coenzyme PQQ synthesis protein D (PqqD)